MIREKVTGFGGIAGRVTIEAVSPGTLVTGLTLGSVLVLGNWLFLRWGAGAFGTAFTQLVLAVAYARFAVNGLYGCGRGTVFRSAGGSWAEVVPVAGRYMLLNLIWISPLLLSGLDPWAGVTLPHSMAGVVGIAHGRPPSLVALYLLGMALTPPVLLVASVGSHGLAEVFSPSHIRGLFSGRVGDLCLIYILYIGALSAILVPAIPLVMLVGARKIGMGIALGALVLSFLGGLVVTLLGRLCGFYAFGEELDPGERPPIESPLPGVVLPAVSGEPRPAATPRKPPLLDAAARVEDAWHAFEQDPQGAISALEELRETHAPHDQVVQALCLMLQDAGREEEAVEMAHEAIPLCLERRHVALAAEIFRAVHVEPSHLDIENDERIAIGTHLLKTGDHRSSANAFAAVLREDAGDKRAVKGLLQVAELNLRAGGLPEDARKIFRFLLDRCLDSPLVDDMRHGLAEAERRLAHEESREQLSP